MKKVVLTGGPYSGKTTTINQLQALGYLTLSEVAIEVIQEHPDLRSVDQFAFQTLVVNRQIEREAAIPEDEAKFVFLDRSVIDSIAYCTLRDIQEPPGLDEACRATDYHVVFALETLSEFSQRAETGRTSTKEISHQTFNLLVDAYATYGYRVIPVPERPVEERIAFILNTLTLGE